MIQVFDYEGLFGLGVFEDKTGTIEKVRNQDDPSVRMKRKF